MTYRDNYRVVGIEIFGVEFVFVGDDLGASFVAIFFFHFDEFLLHHFFAALRIVENLL